MTVEISQVSTLEGDQVKAMIAQHYQGTGVPVVPSNIHFRVHEGSSGSFSSSGPSLGDTIIYFHGQKRGIGMPDSITLRPEQIKEIAAAFFSEALGFTVAPSSIRLNVSGASGSGFSRSSASLDSISVRSTLKIHGR